MIQRGRRPYLAQEPLGTHALRDVLPQNLDRHLRIGGLIPDLEKRLA